jgi:biopolymer transport protein ExbB
MRSNRIRRFPWMKASGARRGSPDPDGVADRRFPELPVGPGFDGIRALRAHSEGGRPSVSHSVGVGRPAHSKVLCGILALHWLILLMASPAFASDPSPAARPGASGDGAVAWWLLLGLSVGAMAIVFDSLLAFRIGRIAPTPTADALAAAIRSRSLDNALRLGNEPAHNALLTRVVLAGVQLAHDHADATADEIRSAAQDEGEALASRLYWRVDALTALGAIAPLIGLLGTTLALVASLGRLAASGDAARAADISAAAGKALSTTVLGLLIAVPSLVAANLLRARLEMLTREAGRRAEQILRPLGRR